MLVSAALIGSFNNTINAVSPPSGGGGGGSGTSGVGARVILAAASTYAGHQFYGAYSSSPYTTITLSTTNPTNVWSSVLSPVTSFASSGSLVMGISQQGSTGNVATTANGITWNNVATLPAYNPAVANAYWSSLAYGNNTWVAVVAGANTTQAAYSTDNGNTWTSINPFSSSPGRVVRYSNNIFLVTNGSSTYTSTDGITWASTTVTAASTSVQYATDKNAWYSLALTGTANQVSVQKSTNNYSSATTSTATLSGVSAYNSIFWAYGNGTFVVIQQGSASSWTSSDAVTWTQNSNVFANTNNCYWSSLIFNGTVFFASSTTIASYVATYWTSADGITWTQVSTYPANPYGTQGLSAVSFINLEWLAVAGGYPTTSAIVYSITSGVLASTPSTIYSSFAASSYHFEPTVSPQNDFIYFPNGTKNWIDIIPVDPATGIYTGSGATTASILGGTSFPMRMRISPDGKNAYVFNNNAGQLAIYSRNTTTGALTGVSTTSGYGGLILNSTGTNLYIASGTDGIITYSRNTSTGALTQVWLDSQYINSGFIYNFSLAITNDSTSLFVADGPSNTLWTYTLDSVTGQTSLSQQYNFGSNFQPYGVVVSNDGKFVYVALYDVNQTVGPTVKMFTRSLSSPYTLTLSNTYATGGTPGDQPAGFALTKNQDLLVWSGTSNYIHSWTRNTTTGALTLNADVAGHGAGVVSNN